MLPVRQCSFTDRLKRHCLWSNCIRQSDNLGSLPLRVGMCSKYCREMHDCLAHVLRNVSGGKWV